MWIVRAPIIPVLTAGALLVACGSGGSHPRLAEGASTTEPAPAPGTTVALPPVTGMPGAAHGQAAAAPTTTTQAHAKVVAAAVTTAPTSPPMTAAPTTAAPTTTAPRTTTTAAAPGYTFHERDYAFAPSTFTVPSGTRVTIVNDGPSTHTWTADSGAWDSGDLSPGASYAHVFSTPGTFGFKCSIHPSMQGSVTVT